MSHKPRLLIYAFASHGLHFGWDECDLSHCKLVFAHFETELRLDEFDGVVFINGTFESFKQKVGPMEVYYDHSCHRDMLDRRDNELRLLIEKGGLVCALLAEPIFDQVGRRDYPTTDLAKRLLNHFGIRRSPVSERQTALTPKFDEFRDFLKRYGAAQTELSVPSIARELATFAGHCVALVVDGRIFIVPTLLPASENSMAFLEELSQSFIALHHRLITDVPRWTEEFRFSEEIALLDEQAELEERLERAACALKPLQGLKRALVATGETLVDAVELCFRDGLNLKVEKIEDYRDDLKLLDESGNPFALVEVKGVNGSLKRENINQADSHRESAGFPTDFPALLVLNAHRQAEGIARKDQDLPSDQIKHAVRQQVLVMRTLDLLRLIELHQSNQISREKIGELFKTATGWLKVQSDSYEVVI